MRKAHTSCTAAKKIAILRSHLVDGVSAAALAKEHDLGPATLYSWRRQLFENGVIAFGDSANSKRRPGHDRVADLESSYKEVCDRLDQLLKQHVELKKKSWGTLKGAWVPREIRDDVVDHVNRWCELTGIPANRIIVWLGISLSKFHAWRHRYGKDNTHNATVVRGWWLEDWEKKAIIGFHSRFPHESYRSLTFMMLDADVVAVSPSSVRRVLVEAGRMLPAIKRPSFKTLSFRQSHRAHERWDLEVSELHLRGDRFYFVSVVDCCTRFIVHWELRSSVAENEIAAIIERARARYPLEQPALIANTAPSTIAEDLKQFMLFSGKAAQESSRIDHQKDSTTARSGGSQDTASVGEDDPPSREPTALRLVEAYVRHYNEERLHPALGYVTPADKLAGRDSAILAQRQVKLKIARQRRAEARKDSRSVS